MSPAARQWETLERYVRKLADQLGLRDWQIELEQVPADAEEDGVDGSVRVTYGRRRAYIRLGTGCLDWEPRRLRVVVVHELLHLHVKAIEHIVEYELAAATGPEAHRVISQAHHRAVENAVDAIAEAVAPRLPLIEMCPMEEAPGSVPEKFENLLGGVSTAGPLRRIRFMGNPEVEPTLTLVAGSLIGPIGGDPLMCSNPDGGAGLHENHLFWVPDSDGLPGNGQRCQCGKTRWDRVAWDRLAFPDGGGGAETKTDVETPGPDHRT